MSEYGELKWTDVSEDYVRAYSTYHSEEMFEETAVFWRPKNMEHYRLTNLLIQGRLWLYTLTQERSLRSMKKQFALQLTCLLRNVALSVFLLLLLSSKSIMNTKVMHLNLKCKKPLYLRTQK